MDANHQNITEEEPQNRTAPISVQNNFCRTCLSKTNLRPIFDESTERADKMTNVFRLLSILEIKKNDALSQNICNECLKIIDIIISFREKCKKTEEALLKMVPNTIKMEPDDDCAESESNEVRLEAVKVEFESPEHLQIDVKVQRLPDIDQTASNIDENLIDNDILNGTSNFTNVNFEEENDDFNSEISKDCFDYVKDKVPHNKEYSQTPLTPAERQKLYRERLKLDTEKYKIYQMKKMIAYQNRKRLQQTMPKKKFQMPKEPFTCEICKRQYWIKQSYMSHMRTHRVADLVCEVPRCHHQQFTISCRQECGRAFQRRAWLDHHRRVRHGLGRVECPHCDYTSATREGLGVHLRDHTGERPYVCDHCGAGFLTRRTLTQHLGIHQPATIQCPSCPKKLRSEKLLANHKADRHGKLYRFIIRP